MILLDSYSSFYYNVTLLQHLRSELAHPDKNDRQRVLLVSGLRNKLESHFEAVYGCLVGDLPVELTADIGLHLDAIELDQRMLKAMRQAGWTLPLPTTQ